MMKEVVYQPGDKIYKLLKHCQVLIKGKDETFIISIKKVVDQDKKQ